jgi:hypothetical protein
MNCSFINISISAGSGAAFSFSGGGSFINCLFYTCVSPGNNYGGVIYVVTDENSYSLSLSYCCFYNCSSGSGGAVYCGKIIIIEFSVDFCNFVDNTITGSGSGAGIYFVFDTALPISLLINNSYFFNSGSSEGGRCWKLTNKIVNSYSDFLSNPPQGYSPNMCFSPSGSGTYHNLDGNDEVYDTCPELSQKEVDWLNEWHNYYKWDENKKEYNSNGKRVKQDYVGFSQQQIQSAEVRKKKEHDLKKKHLLAMYMHFDPTLFDVNENYENEWIKKYNKERVKHRYQTTKENNGNVSPPPFIVETGNFVQVNNQLNLPSSSLSSSLPSRSFNYSSKFVIFAPLTSAKLAYSLYAD